MLEFFDPKRMCLRSRSLDCIVSREPQWWMQELVAAVDRLSNLFLKNLPQDPLIHWYAFVLLCHPFTVMFSPDSRWFSTFFCLSVFMLLQCPRTCGISLSLSLILSFTSGVICTWPVRQSSSNTDGQCACGVQRAVARQRFAWNFANA